MMNFAGCFPMLVTVCVKPPASHFASPDLIFRHRALALNVAAKLEVGDGNQQMRAVVMVAWNRAARL